MSDVHPARVVLKAIIIFVVLNLAFGALNPPVGQLSIYNWLVNGRERFPTGHGRGSYNVAVDDLDALFTSHRISNGPKPSDEYRVLLLGDSETWGWTLTASQTLTGQLNRANLHACGRHLQFYNLAAPGPSVLRDFLVLNKSLQYQPDLVVWMLTMDSFRTQTLPPGIFSNDAEGMSKLLRQYNLVRYINLVAPAPSLWQQTLVGEGPRLSKLALLQLYGLMWDATKIDIRLRVFAPPSTDVLDSEKYSTLLPPTLPVSSMTFDVLESTHRMIGDLAMLIVNEPIYIAPGRNSNIRYNTHYPRWAYDQYRPLLQRLTTEQGWEYVDMYNAIPYTDFASPFLHLTLNGEKKVSNALTPQILKFACP